MQTAIYLFCLARAERLPDFGIPGFNDESPVLRRDVANVTAVICEVALDEFCGPSAETRLQDVTWVGPRALRHGQIIEAAMQYSPVLPARFGALFSSVDRLEELVKRNLAEITAFLDAVSDKDEWAVKVLLSRSEVREKLFSEKLAEHEEVLASLAKGARYFRERQLRAAVEKEIRGRVKDIMRVGITELTECSADRRKREILFRGNEASEKETISHWAFLVARGNEEDFRTRITRANAENNSCGLSFHLSGPWPPYSFTPALRTEPEA